MIIYSPQDFMLGFVAGVAFLGFALAFSVALVVNFGKDRDPRRLSAERFFLPPPPWEPRGPATTASDGESGPPSAPPERSTAPSQSGPLVP